MAAGVNAQSVLCILPGPLCHGLDLPAQNVARVLGQRLDRVEATLAELRDQGRAAFTGSGWRRCS